MTKTQYDIPKEAFESDLALLDRYQAFSAELVRISLLGVGLVGFFFTKPEVRNDLSTIASTVAAGAFAFATALALGHRYFSSDGIHYHLKSLRSTSETERTVREGHRNGAYKRSGGFLSASVVSAAVGAVSAAIALVGAVLHLH